MDKYHFTVVEKGGKEHGLYISSTPSSAAKKAVSKLCSSNKSKKVEFYLREITQGSKKKIYGPYLGYIEKLKEPIELKGRIIRYKPIVKLSDKKITVKKGGIIGGAPKAEGPAQPAVNSFNFINNSENPVAGPAVAVHNDANKQFKDLCQKAIHAINIKYRTDSDGYMIEFNQQKTFPGSNLHTFPDLKKSLSIGVNHNELRKYNAIFIKREKSPVQKENPSSLPSDNMTMINEVGKKAAVERFMSELNSDMSINEIFKEAWYCVIYYAFQNLQIAFPRKVIINHPLISVNRGSGLVEHCVKNKNSPYEQIKIHGFVNDFQKPARYDKSGLKPVELMRKKTNFNYWNHPTS